MGDTGVKGTIDFSSTSTIWVEKVSGSAVMTAAATPAREEGVEIVKGSTLEWVEEWVSLGRIILANLPNRSIRGELTGGEEAVETEAEGERLVSFLNVFERVGAGEEGTLTGAGAGGCGDVTGFSTGTAGTTGAEAVGPVTSAVATGRVELSITISSTISSTNVVIAGVLITCVDNWTSAIS